MTTKAKTPLRSRGQRALAVAFALGFLAADAAIAQDKGTLNPKPLPPLAKPDDPGTPAKELFGRKPTPAPLRGALIGFYAKGCLAGASALPINGQTWQVMRLSRNRNWGHPSLVQFLERLAEKGAKAGWRGLLVGDMSQPRGGPMLTGHASHQVGLDADIWLTPMPDRELTRREREEMSATMVVAEDRKDVDPERLDAGARRTSSRRPPRTRRSSASSSTRRSRRRSAARPATTARWLHKVRPWWGHDYHFHVRIQLSGGQPRLQAAGSGAGRDDGCGKELDYWFTDAVLHPKPPPPNAAASRRPPITMADLPPACRQVLLAP